MALAALCSFTSPFTMISCQEEAGALAAPQLASMFGGFLGSPDVARNAMEFVVIQDAMESKTNAFLT